MSDEFEQWTRRSVPTRRPNGASYRRDDRSLDDSPAAFTEEWYARRSAVLDEIARKSRSRGVEWTEEQRETSRLASELSVLQAGMLGYHDARNAWEDGAAERLARHSGMTPEQQHAKWAKEAEMHRSRGCLSRMRG